MEQTFNIEEAKITEEIPHELNLRPKSLAEYIGQEKLKENLNIFITAAKKRKQVLDHALFYGPPGLGKTTLANIIAHELGVSIKSTSGPAIEKQGDLAAILTNLQEGDVLFIDEIHRLHPVIEEVLYPAMEDFKLDIIIGQGPSARSIKLDLPRFTLIGATTRAGLLTSPLRDRFGIIMRLELYNENELILIAKRSSRILGIELDESGAQEIARRSRGTPRITNRLLKRVSDYALVLDKKSVDQEISIHSLNAMGIDECGLNKMDREILMTIIKKYNGGPVGIETISASVNEDKNTLEDVYEPFLIQAGFIDKTLRGRIATKMSYEHFNIEFTNATQKELFE